MKRKISFRLFCTVLWGGICQFFQSIARFFGYKGESTYAKVVWRILVGCFTAWFVTITGYMLYSFTDEVIIDEWIQPNRWDYTWEEQYLSDQLVVQNTRHYDNARIYNIKQQKVVLKDLDWVIPSADSLAVFAQHGKRGYINRFTGEIIIPATYTRAWIFSEGLAAVEKNGTLVFIDHAGNVVIDNAFRVHHIDPQYVFHGGHCVMQDSISGLAGLIDTQGQWAVQPMYDKISYHKGFWLVEDGGYEGLLSVSTLDVLLPIIHENIWFYDDCIEGRQNDHIAKRYDYQGNIVVDFVIDDVQNLIYETTMLRNDIVVDEYSEVDRSVYAVANAQCYKVYSGDWDEYYGLLGRDGRPITMPLYTTIEAIAADLYLCHPDGIIINGKGERVE